MSYQNLSSLLQSGIAAAQAGQRQQARSLLSQAVRLDPNDELAWFWLASVLDDPQEIEYCLTRVLALNPTNHEARQQLDRLRSPSYPPPAAVPDLPPIPPARAQKPVARPGRRGGLLSRRQWLALGGVLVVTVLVFALALALLVSQQSKLGLPLPGSATVVENSAREFIGQPSLQFQNKGSSSYAFGELCELEATLPDGDRVSLSVDTTTNEVRGLFRYGQSAQTIQVTLEQAQATATAFAREHYPDLDELEAVQAKLIDHGPGTSKHYSFRWVKVDPTSGAILPKMVAIRVNAQTGKVDSYLSFCQETTVSTVPQVSQEQAQRIAVAITTDRMGSPHVVEAGLLVSTVPVYQPGGTQTLLWQVIVEGTPYDSGYVPGAFVFIDAQTGAVLHIEPYV